MKRFGGKSRNWLARSEGELKANALIYSLFYLFNYFYSLVECSLFRDVFKDSFDALIFIFIFFPNRNNPEYLRFGKILIIIMSCSAFLISSQC